jgi:hypothetical protein
LHDSFVAVKLLGHIHELRKPRIEQQMSFVSYALGPEGIVRRNAGRNYSADTGNDRYLNSISH